MLIAQLGKINEEIKQIIDNDSSYSLLIHR